MLKSTSGNTTEAFEITLSSSTSGFTTTLTVTGTFLLLPSVATYAQETFCITFLEDSITVTECPSTLCDSKESGTLFVTVGSVGATGFGFVLPSKETMYFRSEISTVPTVLSSFNVAARIVCCPVVLTYLTVGTPSKTSPSLQVIVTVVDSAKGSSCVV